MNCFLHHNGRNIEAKEITVDASIDSYAWKMSATLAKEDDFNSIYLQDIVVASLFGEMFYFVVDGTSYSKDGTNEPQMGFTGISKTIYAEKWSPLFINYDVPSQTDSSTDDTPKPPAWAAQIAARALGYGGIGLIWLTQNWLISYGIFNAKSESPMAICERLAKAIGSVVNSTKDGTVIVRRKRGDNNITLSAHSQIESLTYAQSKETAIKQVTVLQADPMAKKDGATLITMPYVNVALDDRLDGLNAKHDISFSEDTRLSIRRSKHTYLKSSDTFYAGDEVYLLVNFANGNLNYGCSSGTLTSQGVQNITYKHIINVNENVAKLQHPANSIIECISLEGVSVSAQLSTDGLSITVNKMQYGSVNVTYSVNTNIFMYKIDNSSITEPTVHDIWFQCTANQDKEKSVVTGMNGKELVIIDELLDTPGSRAERAQQEFLNETQTISMNIKSTYLKNIELTDKISFTYNGKTYSGWVKSIRHTADKIKALTQLELFA